MPQNNHANTYIKLNLTGYQFETDSRISATLFQYPCVLLVLLVFISIISIISIICIFDISYDFHSPKQKIIYHKLEQSRITNRYIFKICIYENLSQQTPITTWKPVNVCKMQLK